MKEVPTYLFNTDNVNDKVIYSDQVKMARKDHFKYYVDIQIKLRFWFSFQLSTVCLIEHIVKFTRVYHLRDRKSKLSQ